MCPLAPFPFAPLSAEIGTALSPVVHRAELLLPSLVGNALVELLDFSNARLELAAPLVVFRLREDDAVGQGLARGFRGRSRFLSGGRARAGSLLRSVSFECER